MANLKSKQVAFGLAAASALMASAVVPVTGEYTVKAGDAIGDIVEMGAVPAGCIVVDVIVDNGALGAGATLDVGVLSGDYAAAGVRTMGNEYVAAAAAAAAGVIRRNKPLGGVQPELTDKGWGIKFLGANPAAGQVIRATMLVRSAIS